MDIRVLKYFIAVAHEKNITRAAQKLFISQPALSKQLKELEEELGVKLFERGNRTINLTDEGLFLFSQAQKIIDLTEKTINNISKSNEDIYGEIFIGAGETRGLNPLVEIFKKLLEIYPNIKINIFSGDLDSVLKKLENGALDFGLVLEKIPKNNFDFLKLPHFETLGLLSTKDGIFSKYDSIEVKDLLGLPLIVSKQMKENLTLEQLSGNDFSKLNIIGTYNLLYNASLMVENKIGHAICIDGIINTENTNLKFIPFKSFERIDLNLIWKKGISLSKASTKFLELCFKTFK